jgi:hypothetical protein
MSNPLLNNIQGFYSNDPFIQNLSSACDTVLNSNYNSNYYLSNTGYDYLGGYRLGVKYTPYALYKSLKATYGSNFTNIALSYGIALVWVDKSLINTTIYDTSGNIKKLGDIDFITNLIIQSFTWYLGSFKPQVKFVTNSFAFQSILETYPYKNWRSYGLRYIPSYDIDVMTASQINSLPAYKLNIDINSII